MIFNLSCHRSQSQRSKMARFEERQQDEAHAKLKELLHEEARQMARAHTDILNLGDANTLAKIEAQPVGSLNDLNFALWMYYQGIMGNIFSTDTKTVLKSIEALHARGVNINQEFSGNSGNYTAGHLLADCHGDIFMVNYTDSRMTHKDVLLTLLELGLDENVKNTDHQTPIDYANQVEGKHGLGTSMFLQSFKPWALNKKMQATISRKGIKSTGKI